jgi:hypothetical protein
VDYKITTPLLPSDRAPSAAQHSGALSISPQIQARVHKTVCAVTLTVTDFKHHYALRMHASLVEFKFTYARASCDELIR